MGGMGDGIALHEGRPVFVPFTCAGDVVRAKVKEVRKESVRAEMVELLTPSQDRRTPPCPHFGSCGGCALQHLAPHAYSTFKQQQIAAMLQSLGADPATLQPLVEVGAHSRRRAELKVSVQKGTVLLGFQKEESHELVDIACCPVVECAIEDFLPALRQQLGEMKKPSLVTSVQITSLEAGLDVVLCAKAPFKPADQQGWITFAKSPPILRLSLSVESRRHPVILSDTGQAVLSHGGVNVALPVGAFCQASAEAEQVMKTLVTEALQHCSSVMDLYAGCGTFSFPLARQAKQVMAVEGSEEMIWALQNAANTAGLADKMVTEVRDLFASPIPAAQLSAYEGVVINPPRNGALPQVKEIARSGIANIVMVSCNPATFQRDAAYLLQAGYLLTSLTPIDQFTWSRHLELVAVFEGGSGG